MANTLSDIIAQNTLGKSDGFPLGVPKDYSWYKGWSGEGTKTPPAGFSAVEGWGQVYQQAGAAANSNSAATVQVAEAKTYVRLRETGQWTLVQDQSRAQIAGAHFVTDFSGNAGYDLKVNTRADGSAAFAAPPSGYNDHFWYGSRGTYSPGSVDAVYVQMDMRVTDPKADLVASVGADWWRDANAPYVDGFGNNPGIGVSNWVKLSTEWQTVGFFSPTKAEFQENLPPPLLGSTPDIDVRPPPIDPGPSPTPTGDNLLVNGSFENSVVRSGTWAEFNSTEGWTAVTGSSIELWNDLNGVKASGGNNFGELDFLGSRDGFFQNVKTAEGRQYNLSFDMRSRPGFGGSTCSTEVLWNDSVVATIPPGGDWKKYSLSVVGTGGKDRLTIREVAGQGADGLGALYDNFSLVAKRSDAARPDHSVAAANINRSLDRSVDLLRQHSAACLDDTGAASGGLFGQVQPQALNEHTLTQPHQIT